MLTNESVSKSPNSCFNSLLYRFLQYPFTLNPPNILFEMFVKEASRLAIVLFKHQDSAPYVAIGIVNVLQIFIFFVPWLYRILHKTMDLPRSFQGTHNNPH